MKYLILVLFCLSVLGCGPEKSTKVEKINPYIQIIKVRDCEYIKYVGLSITHAGDCPNPIHCYNKIED